MINYPEIEFRPADEIKRYQQTRLTEALEYLDAKSPFYKRMFAQNHIDIRKIKTLEDLRVVPTTEKHDLQIHNKDFLCVPKEDIIDYITTSGTMSDPVTFAMTDKDLDRLAYNEKISFMCAGAEKGDIFQLMTTIDKRFMAGLAYFLGIRKLGAGIIRVGNGIPELQWDTIRRIEPDTLICVPSFILKIINYAEEHGIDYRSSSVRKAVCIGENLRESDFSLNMLGQSIKEKWDIELYSTYASTEMSTTFCECRYGCGGHHHPELIICELIDEQGNVIDKDGEYGELVVTTLGVEGMPLLRFRTGDIAAFYHEPCRCGRQTMRISPIRCRRNHMLKYKGTTIYPPSIYDVLDNTPFVSVYQIEVTDNEIGTDNVGVDIALTDDMDSTAAIKELKDRFRAKLRVAPDVRVVAEAELRKRVFRETDRKPTKLVDKRKH